MNMCDVFFVWLVFRIFSLPNRVVVVVLELRLTMSSRKYYNGDMPADARSSPRNTGDGFPIATLMRDDK